MCVQNPNPENQLVNGPTRPDLSDVNEFGESSAI